jgi:hypothetical protein
MMQPSAKCLCGQAITDTPGWRFRHMMAHVSRGEAKQVKATTEKNAVVLPFTAFEWTVKQPKPIKGTTLPRRWR